MKYMHNSVHFVNFFHIDYSKTTKYGEYYFTKYPYSKIFKFTCISCYKQYML